MSYVLTCSTVLQHWMGPVVQDEGGSPPPPRTSSSTGVAAARRGTATRAKVATRENMLVSGEENARGLSDLDLKPEDLSLVVQALLYLSGHPTNP